MTVQETRQLRYLQTELDQAVLAAYGFTLDCERAFYDTKDGIRYTPSKEVRSQICDEILRLNHERYEAEVTQGPARQKEKRGR